MARSAYLIVFVGLIGLSCAQESEEKAHKSQRSTQNAAMVGSTAQRTSTRTDKRNDGGSMAIGTDDGDDTETETATSTGSGTSTGTVEVDQPPKAFTIVTLKSAYVAGDPVELSWQASDAGVEYAVSLHASNDCNSLQRALDATTMTKVSIADLMAGTYYVCVEASNADGLETKATNNGQKLRVFAPKSAAELAAAATLKATDLYVDFEAREVAPWYQSYEPKYPLWTDGTVKSRWIALPRGGKIDASDPDNWTFPTGTVAFKEFKAGTKVLETRMLVKTGADNTAASWKAVTFVWKDDQTDAVATTIGAAIANGVQAGINYNVPTEAQCRTCHNGVADTLIGFSALQLDGVSGLNLASLVTAQAFVSPPARTPTLNVAGAATAAADRAALGYLHGNCGHCHNPRATAAKRTGSAFRHEGNITTFGAEPSYATTVASILPGNPNGSAVITRMTSTPIGMPKIGVAIKDDAGINALKAWIQGLPAH